MFDEDGAIFTGNPAGLPRDFNPKRMVRILLRDVPGDDLQALYDGCGRDLGNLARVLAIRGAIGPKRLARGLYDRGVILHPTELEKYGIMSPLAKARVEMSQYALFDLGDGFDPEAMMEEAVESDLDPSIFEDMDIREIPRPANFFEWITGRQYLNTTIFPRQFQVNATFFEEWCWWCTDKEFVKDIHLSPHMGEDGFRRAWTNEEILSRVQLLEHGVCPKCKRTYIDNLNEPNAPHCFPKELDACIGQRAGKTRMTEHMTTYNEMRYQLLSPSPQAFFGEDSTQKFSAIFTALQLSQAQDTLWGAYHLRVMSAPWFKTYHKWLDDHGRKLGAELYRIKDTYHWYANTLLHSVLRPPFAKEMRGRTGFQMGIDEIGMFAKGEGKVRANADEVHKSMNNALMTIRANSNRLIRQGRLNVPRPAMFCISSPWEILDKIMTLVRTADRDPTRVAFHYPTWEFNPKIRRNDEQMTAEYANDPVAAERDFGAIPPFAKDPFHENPDVIDLLSSPGVRQVFKQRTKHVRTKSGKCLVYAIPAGLKPDKVTPRLLVIDAGEADNSFAISIWSLKELPAPRIDSGNFDEIIDDEDDEDIRIVLEAIAQERAANAQVEEQKGNVEYLQCDGAIEIQPFSDEAGNDYRVSFSKTWEKCLRPMLQALNIVAMVSDRWNITQILNSAEEMGVYTEQYSLVRNDFLDFKGKTDSREIRLPMPEKPFSEVYEDYDRAIHGSPILHLMVQYKTVRNVGRTVAKPSGGTDDLYRTMVLAHRFAFSEDAVRVVDKREVTINELLRTNGKAERVNRAVSVVMMRGQGGSGGHGGSQSSLFSRVGGYVSRSGGGGGAAYSNVATRGSKGGSSTSGPR